MQVEKDIPKISIVIPVYNVEDYIEECLESLINQTLRDIEIICIDDYSTDTSLSILNKYAQIDSRIKVISYPTNKSASQARKDGVLLSAGQFIMFLDGDDYLELNACEQLYRLMLQKDVDMIHFGTNIINHGNVPEQRLNNLAKLLMPHQETLVTENVFEACFIEKKFRFTIWNKIYRSELCKKAFQYIRDGYLPKAQDLYAFFVICYFANSYCGVEDKYYNYRFGSGITGKTTISLKQLDIFCHSSNVANEIHNFLIDVDDSTYHEIALTLRKDLLADCVNNWYNCVKNTDSSAGFDILCKYWNSQELISILCEKFYNERKKLADKILGAQALTTTEKKEIRTVGIFYHRISIGGVQRVLSLLIPLYLKMGYNVVFFTDEYHEGNEYSLPNEVTRVMLPTSLKMAKDQYHTRAVDFVEHIKKYNVDVMCYHAASSPMLLFDTLLLKLNHVPMVVTTHEVAFQNMLSMNIEMTKRPSVFRLLDVLVTLSSTDEKYWRTLGVNAIYIPNPITATFTERDPSKIEKNTIVWISRLDTLTKRCMDVIEIMRYVVLEIPDAKLLVVGNEVTEGIMEKMQTKIDKLGLQNNVILCGHSTDVDSYYEKAEVHLITSVSESFSMAIAESKSFGLPLVMYELPFIEFCKDSRGFLSAPQGDAKKAAEYVVNILQNDDLKHQLSLEAHESLRDFISLDLGNEWNTVFNQLGSAYNVSEKDEELEILISSLLQHYEYGVIANNAKIQKIKSDEKHKQIEIQKELQKQNKKLKKQLTKIKSSKDYRLGHYILKFPRKIWRKIKRLTKH